MSRRTLPWLSGVLTGAALTFLLLRGLGPAPAGAAPELLAQAAAPGRSSPPPTAPPPSTAPVTNVPRNTQIVVDERDLRTVYANAFRVHATNEEIVIDLGFIMPNPNANAGGDNQLFKVSERLIMTHSNAARLMLSLNQLIRFEQRPAEPAPAPAPASEPPGGKKTR